MNNSIIFCTAFKDICRREWSHYSRSNTEYIKYFLQMANNIKYNLVVYLEDDVSNLLKEHTFNSNIIFKPYNEVNTFYDEYLENEKIMIDSQVYIDKCRYDRRIQNPEHWCAKYNLVNHSKVNFVRHTKECFPQYGYYSWIDFGCIRDNLKDIPNMINFDKLTESIIYLTLVNPPSEKIPAEYMLKSDTVFLTGSQFVIHTNLVNKFEMLYRNLLEKWKSDIICDDDQNAVLQIYFDNRSLFNLYLDNEWFSLFRKHLNANIILKDKLDISKLINAVNNTGKYIEIGVARGSFTKYILNNTKVDALLIDPYKNFSLDEYTDAMNFYNMDEEFKICQMNLLNFNHRIKFIRKTSNNAKDEIEDNSIDFVYIDGNHSYDACMDDIKNYWPKLKSCGYILGDDVYEFSEDKDVMKFWDNKDITNSTSFGKYGVHAAVVDFCKGNKLNYLIFSNQFIILKP